MIIGEKEVRAFGSAFPDDPYFGMSLRDWFAGMAMQGYIAGGVPVDVSHRELADKVYRMADAMLEERDKK